MRLRRLHARLCRLRQCWPDDWVGLPAVLHEVWRALDLHHDCDLAACAEDVSAWIEADGARRRNQDLEPAYHNRMHTGGTLLALAALLATVPDRQLWSRQQHLLLLTMTAHDLLHDGSFNRYPKDLEQRSFNHLQPLLGRHGIADDDQRRIQQLMLATDPTCVPEHHRKQRSRVFDLTDVHWQAVLLQEADVLASALPGLGEWLTADLAAEWERVAPARAAALRQPSGRLGFLRHGASFISPAAHALGLPRIVRRQALQLQAADGGA